MKVPRPALITSCILALTALGSQPARAQFDAPPGGWAYTYEAGAGDGIAGAPDSGFTSLDGTWSHDNGSDQWDGSPIGSGRPGGVMIVEEGDTSYLRLQETGDPRDHGDSDPGSNRKLYFGHDVGADGAGMTVLDDGATLNFRVRLPTPDGAPLDDLRPDGGGPIEPYPAGGDGYQLHNGDKGSIGIKQASGGLLSFVLDPDRGLVFNALDAPDQGQAIALDPTEWHDVWVAIRAGGAGTHRATVWLDGSLIPAGTFDFTAGVGSDFDGISYLAIGLGSTGQSGAIDVDYLRFAPGDAPPPCPGEGPPELEGAFAFGSRNLTCETASAPGTNYTMIQHVNTPEGYDAIAYDAARGYGFVVTNPGAAGRNTAERFGPFDDSPNNRNKFDDDCPDELYDSFMGFKNFAQECDDTVAGDNGVCDEGDLSRPRGDADPANNADPYVVTGGTFRVDVPNGFYRFVGAFGSADNPHVTRVVAEDGGSGPAEIGANHVVLVNNYNQGVYGTGVFARVGFDDKLPPEGNGIGADPRFQNIDENGLVTACPPNSPVLEVTQGYVSVHLLQGNRGAPGAGDPNGGDIVLLELWKVPCPVISQAFAVDLAASVEGDVCRGDGNLTVTISASNVQAPAKIELPLPKLGGPLMPSCVEIVDAGGGTVANDVLSFDADSDGDLSFVMNIGGCCPADGPISFTASATAEGACPSSVDFDVSCCPFTCTPDPEDEPPELAGAFLFGSRNLACPTYNDPSVDYTVIQHVNSPAGYDAIAYSPDVGYGFEVIAPGAMGRNTAERFGPFDDSPNNRNRFGDDCPDEIYDSFIGFKNHPQTCDQAAVGNTVDPCTNGLTLPDDSAYNASGGVFRVDVPNGRYRFVAAFGEADNPHATRVLAQDGGSGPPSQLNPDDRVVTLVYNHDQAQWDIGTARADCLGCGVFARVGFNCRIPPLGDGAGADPVFVNMNEEGKPAGAGPDGVYGTPDDPPPSSPTLDVTSGYIRFHLLQGNSNDGPGGKGLDPVTGIGGRDPNGADVVIIEVWRVGDSEAAPCDTHCNGLDVALADEEGATVRATAFAADDSGGAISYTFTATAGGADPVTVGPQPEDSAAFDLPPGEWTISVTVADDSACAPPAADDTCSATITVPEPGGGQIPGDCNQDGKVDISDASCLLGFLVLGTPDMLPCGDGSGDAAGNVALMDWNDDAAVNLSDAIAELGWLFTGGPPHVLDTRGDGTTCVRLELCPNVCTP